MGLRDDTCSVAEMSRYTLHDLNLDRSPAKQRAPHLKEPPLSKGCAFRVGCL